MLTILSAPITVGITVILIFHSFLSSLVRWKIYYYFYLLKLLLYIHVACFVLVVKVGDVQKSHKKTSKFRLNKLLDFTLLIFRILSIVINFFPIINDNAVVNNRVKTYFCADIYVLIRIFYLKFVYPRNKG